MDPIGISLCLVITGLFIAGPMWRMNVLTIPDFFRLRYGKVAEIICALILVPSYFGWIAAQFVALATILSQMYGGSLSGWIVAVAIIGSGYSLMGGMWSITITDALQLILIIAGLLVLGYEILWTLGQGMPAAGLARVTHETPASFWRLADEPTFYRGRVIGRIDTGDCIAGQLAGARFDAARLLGQSPARGLHSLLPRSRWLIGDGLDANPGRIVGWLLLDEVPEVGCLRSFRINIVTDVPYSLLTGDCLRCFIHHGQRPSWPQPPCWLIIYSSRLFCVVPRTRSESCSCSAVSVMLITAASVALRSAAKEPSS